MVKVIAVCVLYVLTYWFDVRMSKVQGRHGDGAERGRLVRGATAYRLALALYGGLF
jgi:hypothetical protein